MTLVGIKIAARGAFVLLTLCALLAAPMVIAMTHGPGPSIDSAQAVEQLVHGHSHDEPEPGQFGGSHDATDHEHPTQIVLSQVNNSVFDLSGLRLGMSDVSAGSLPPSGLRRPPKATSV